MKAKLDALKHQLMISNDLESAAALLFWDQSTYMPPGGATARARQSALLSRMAHETFVDPQVGKLLDELRPYEESLPYDSDDASLIRVARREYERKTQVPADLVAETTSHFYALHGIWAEARPKNDFAAVQPHLEKTLELSKRWAECFPDHDHIADPLISTWDYGMKAESIRQIFSELREALVPLVQAIRNKADIDDSCLESYFPEALQQDFGLRVIKDFGYDFERGRQDKTAHPYMIKFSLGDVRITTRFNEARLSDALFSTLHESGHAMYEQGINPAYEGTPLAGGTSAGVHESQSRLWENIVGRSRGFWEHYYPILRDTFPEQLQGVDVESFYRAINKVKPSLIRVEADEVTYNLHVMIRFDLELQMLEGKLAIRDLPEAWNARYTSDLGVTPSSNQNGCMQDVHWFDSFIGGAFQGYTLGNIMSAQFYEAALEAHPSLPEDIRYGQFDTLRGWLTEHIYQHGSKYTAPELIERVTGKPLMIAPYIRYLQQKYGELYSL